MNETDPARLFIGIPIPYKARHPLALGIEEFADSVEKTIDPLNWHITLAWLGGKVENHEQYIEKIGQPLSQSFLPTVNVTHMGKGLKPNLLWAYVKRTPHLSNIRDEIVARLKEIEFPLPRDIDREFVPHITLASFTKEAETKAMADHPINLTWPIKEAILYRSLSTESDIYYKPLSSIPFTT